MVRAIIGVIVGYVAMSLFVFASFTALYLGIGTERSFRPGTYDASTLWLVASFVLAVIAAVLGGFICRKIARGVKPGYILAGIALVLGFVSAAFALGRPDPGPRTGEVSNTDAMMKAKQPAWVALANPVVAVAGIVAGVKLASKKKA